MRAMNDHQPTSFLSPMRPFGALVSGIIILFLGITGPSASPARSEQAVAPAHDGSQDQAPVYTLPKKFTPRARVGGELRGTEGAEPEIQALVPDHVGFTSKKTPLLNWYLSRPTSHEVRFTLIDNKSVRPIFEAPIATPKQAGIFSIDIKDLGLALDPGVQYRWYVSVVRNSSSPSQDIVGGGVIERCDLNDCIMEFGAQVTCSVQTISENSRAGLWYDAMGCLCALIDANPNDAGLRRMRAGLLKQVGLNGVAEWDLRSIQAQQR